MDFKNILQLIVIAIINFVLPLLFASLNLLYFVSAYQYLNSYYPKMMTFIFSALLAFSVSLSLKLYKQNKKKLRYHLLWDTKLNPYCPVHKTSVFPHRNEEQYNLASMWCSECEHEIVLRKQNGDAISYKDAIKNLKTSCWLIRCYKRII